MRKKPVDRTAASSQAAWALLTEGVTSARLETHRLRLLLTRALTLCEKSERRDHLYEVAGDVIQGIPTRLDNLERNLDRTSYALSVLGSDHLRDILPMTDRKVVDDATEHAKPFASGKGGTPRTSAERVADRHLNRRADLDPPLGWPGGPCHVIDRIRHTVYDDKLREELVDDIEYGDELSNPDAARVYGPNLIERNVAQKLPFKMNERKLVIGPHAQYRMDLRGITVPQVRAAIAAWSKVWQDERSKNSPLARRWEVDLAHNEGVRFTDKRSGLTVVFDLMGSDTIKIITTFWFDGLKTHAPGDGGCDQ